MIHTLLILLEFLHPVTRCEIGGMGGEIPTLTIRAGLFYWDSDQIYKTPNPTTYTSSLFSISAGKLSVEEMLPGHWYTSFAWCAPDDHYRVLTLSFHGYGIHSSGSPLSTFSR